MTVISNTPAAIRARAARAAKKIQTVEAAPLLAICAPVEYDIAAAQADVMAEVVNVSRGLGIAEYRIAAVYADEDAPEISDIVIPVAKSEILPPLVKMLLASPVTALVTIEHVAPRVLVAADKITIDAAIYESTVSRARTANGPNVYHAAQGMKLVSKPAAPVSLTTIKPYAAHVDMGVYNYLPRKGDISLVVSTKRISNDVWNWIDRVTGETGVATNWHIENIARGRVTAHMTANRK